MISPNRLYELIKPHRVTQDSELPWAYQLANPTGRAYHNDWGVMSNNPILKALQPWQRIKRIDTAFKVPLPFKIILGEARREWVRYDGSYPLSPGHPVEYMPVWTEWGTFQVPHVFADVAGWGEVTFACWLNDQWTPCFYQYKKMVFGKRLLYYYGLKQDLTVDFFADGRLKSDWMGWFPEISLSWKKVSA